MKVRGRGTPKVLGVGVSVLVLVAVGIFIVAESAGQKSTPTHSAAKPAPRSPTSAAAYSWDFTTSFPSSWGHLVPVSSTGSETLVHTDRSGGYAIYSRPLRLSPGLHQVTAAFRVLQGGLALSVLNVQRGTFITTAVYDARAVGSKLLGVAIPFRLRSAGSVEVVLSNGASGRASNWALIHISITGARSPVATRPAGNKSPFVSRRS